MAGKRPRRKKSTPLNFPHPSKQVRDRMQKRVRLRRKRHRGEDDPLDEQSLEQLDGEASKQEVEGLDPPPQRRAITIGQRTKLCAYLSDILYPSRMLARDLLPAEDLKHLEKLTDVPLTAKQLGLNDKICIRLVKAGYACRWYASHWLYTRFRPEYRYTRIPDYRVGKDFRYGKRDPFSQIQAALNGEASPPEETEADIGADFSGEETSQEIDQAKVDQQGDGT